MYILAVLLPLLSAFIVGLFGRFLGKLGVIFVAIPCLLLAALVSWYNFYVMGLMHKVFIIKYFSWITVGTFDVTWGFLFDSISVCMLVVVTTISTLVHFYSIDYMGEDPHFNRFICYLSLFTFMMLMLVTADNFLQLFFGWEGVGLSPYLLINFWFIRVQANKAAVKAMLMNRFGDFFLGLAIALIFYCFKTLDYGAVFALVPIIAGTDFYMFFINFDKLTVIGLFLFFGAVGKSAQLGLHTWLPDAMEGPTPVSALIHAATMVTAGVFLLVRVSPILEYTQNLLSFIILLAAITAVFASSIGMFQNDIKRVVAFSTTSQLGYMVLACGLSAYGVAMFHLVNHAFFKALLFLSSGAVIHAVADEQDMRKMGGLVNLLPFVHLCIFIGSLALAGAPFLSGFYSKDAILELAFGNFEAIFGYWFATLATFFTAFYSVRLLYYTFYTVPSNSKTTMFNVGEASWIMLIPFIVLFIGSLFSGYILRDLFIGLGTDFWGVSVYVLPSNVYFLESEFLPVYIKLIPTVFSLFGAVSALLFYFKWNTNVDVDVNGSSLFERLIDLSVVRNLYIFFAKRWFFDIYYFEKLGKPLLKFGYYVTFRYLDRGLIEWLGPYGLVKIVNVISTKISNISSGYIYHYFMVSLIIFILLVVVLMNFSLIVFWVDFVTIFFIILMLIFAFAFIN